MLHVTPSTFYIFCYSFDQNCKQLFSTALFAGLVVEDDPFLHNLTITLLANVSWSCKGKYGTLSVLVGHLGSARMLTWHPGIARTVLQQMQEHTLACYVRITGKFVMKTYPSTYIYTVKNKFMYFWVFMFLVCLSHKHVSKYH